MTDQIIEGTRAKSLGSQTQEAYDWLVEQIEQVLDAGEENYGQKTIRKAYLRFAKGAYERA